MRPNTSVSRLSGRRIGRMRLAGLVTAVCVVAWVTAGLAQSRNAFGTPSADQPTPSVAITLQPGREPKGGGPKSPPRSVNVGRGVYQASEWTVAWDRWLPYTKARLP